MSNIATLGLEFTSADTGSQIDALCKKFDSLVKKCGSAQEALNELANGGTAKIVESLGNALSTLKPIDENAVTSIHNLATGLKGLKGIDPESGKHLQSLFTSLNGLPTVDNKTVTQISAVAAAIKNLHGINPDIAGNISAISTAIAGIRPIQPGIAVGIAAFANGLKGVTIGAETISSLSSVSAMMSSLRPIEPTVTTSLRQFISDVNTLAPVKPEIATSIQNLFTSANAVKIDSDVTKQIGELTKTLAGLKVVKPEIAVSVRDIFDSFKNVQAIPADTIESITKFGLATSQFKVIRPAVVASMEKLMNILNNLPNIDAAKTEAMRKLAEATAMFKVIRPKVTQSIKELFDRLEAAKRIPKDISDSITATSNALAGFKVINKRTVENIKNLFAVISTFRPISSDALNSIRTLTDLFNAMSAAGTSGMNKVNGAAGTLNGSLGMMTTRADAANIAFRSLAGAFSVRFMIQAAGDAAKFGLELAYIQTLAQNFDLSAIGTGIMNFSSQLGPAARNAKAYYYAYSSGMRGTEQDLLRFTEENAKLAAVIRSDVIPTMNATTAAINAYGMKARDIGKVSDIFASIIKYGKASGEQLANSFGQVSPTAATLGVKMEELGAAIASLTKIQPTRVAITGLNNMLSKIMKPTKESRLAMEKLGVDMSYSAVQSKGFVNVLREVHTALNGNMEALRNIFPDIRGQRAAMHLLNRGWEDFQQQLVNFQNASGETQREFSVLTNDINAQLQALPITFQKIIAEAGKSMLEVVTLGGALTPLIAAFNNMGEGARSFFGILASGVAVFGAVKAGLLAWNTLTILQARNEKILNAIKAEKKAKLDAEALSQARAAAAAKDATAAEIAQYKAGATTTTMIAKKIRVQAEQLALNAKLTADKIYQIELEISEARARGDNILAMRLEQQLRGQEALMLSYQAKSEAAVAHALKAEAMARYLNAQAAAAEAAAVHVSTGAKLKGMVSSATQSISVGVNAAVGGIGLMSAVPGAIMLAKAIGALAPTMVSLGAAAFGLNTALTATGAGMGVTVTGLNATAFAASLLQAPLLSLGAAATAAGVSVTTTVVAVGALAVGAAALGVGIAALVMLIPGARRAVDSFAESISGVVAEAKEKDALVNMKVDLVKKIQEQIGTSAEAAQEVQSMWQNAAFQELTGLERLNALKKRQAEAEKRVSTNTLQVVQEKEKELSALKKVIANAELSQQEMDKYKDRVEKLSKELEKAKSAYISAQQEQIAVNKAVEDMKNEIRKSVENMRSIIDDQYYKMMSPEEMRVETGNRFLKGVSDYFNARIKGENKLAEEAAKILTKNYDKLYTHAQKKIEQNKKTMENLQKMQMDAMLMTAQTDAAKFAIYQQEQQRMQQEAMTKAAAGDYAGATAAWQKSAQAAQKMISMQNKLAQAEMNANEGTRKMILQMDKFKSSAIGAVDAFSAQAVELQARSFDTIPNMKESTTMQSSAEQMNQELARQTLDFIKSLQGKIQADNQNTEKQQKDYNKIFEEVSKSLKEDANTVKNGFQGIKDALSTTQFKVKIEQGLPTINSVRL